VRICLNQELIRQLPFFLHLRDLEQLSSGLRASAISHDVMSHGRASGNAIYWACIAALLWTIYVLIVTANYAHPDWTISAPIAMGRRGRYLERWACCALCFGWSVASTAFVCDKITSRAKGHGKFWFDQS